MGSIMEIALNNRKNERIASSYGTAIRSAFNKFGHSEYQFTYKLERTLVFGIKKERIAAAKELQRIAKLHNDKKIYITKIGLDLIAGTFQEISLLAGYESSDEYIELATKAIEAMYDKDVFHYSDTIENADELKPLRETNVETSTRDLALRHKVEKELCIENCIYATVTCGLENLYGENVITINSDKFEVLYHIGDTLGSGQDDYYYAQKPFKKGNFDVYANKLIPTKSNLITQGAEALVLHTAGYGYSLIEILLIKKVVTC